MVESIIVKGDATSFAAVVSEIRFGNWIYSPKGSPEKTWSSGTVFSDFIDFCPPLQTAPQLVHIGLVGFDGGDCDFSRLFVTPYSTDRKGFCVKISLAEGVEVKYIEINWIAFG